MSAAGGKEGRLDFVPEGFSVAWDGHGLEVRVHDDRKASLRLPWSVLHDLARRAGAAPQAGGADRAGGPDRPGSPERPIEEALGILELTAGASEDDIRQAHRDLAKVWRPQRFGKNTRLRARAQLRLKQIDRAYAILKDRRPPREGGAPAPYAPPAPQPAATGDDTLVGPRPFSEIRLPENALALLIDDAGRSFFPIRSKLVRVGRYDPVTGALPEVDLTQVDVNRSVSRRHARILFDGGSFLLSEEEGARNGTFLNGQRLTPGKAVPLQSGDKIGFGAISFVFKASEKAGRKPA